MATILTRQQIYTMWVTELQAQQSALTDLNEGSLIDVQAGVTAQILAVLSKLTVEEFAKTFFNSADGPEVTGGADDLQTLAVDHFGDDFARPVAGKATGSVTFSRATTAFGNVLIPAGTALLSVANAAGQKSRYVTTTDVTMTTTSIAANIECDTAGSAGNAAIGAISTIQSTLLDSGIVVTNAAALANGVDKYTDAQYRSYIINKLQSLKGATLLALQATALTVAGVVTATAIETLVTVIPYNPGTSLPVPGAAYFQFPYAYIYIADANGTASATLVNTVQAALDLVRAAGVKVSAVGAGAVSLNWTVAITLNAGGPNFATFQTDKTQLINSMKTYINTLAIGTGFVRATAQTAILAIWGPTGTNDITAIVTSVPTGDVAITSTQKLVAGSVNIV
jgi:hypothetical protein